MLLLVLLPSALAALFVLCVCDGNVTIEDCLTLDALVRLPKLAPGAGAIAAACPFRALPLSGVLVQGAQ